MDVQGPAALFPILGESLETGGRLHTVVQGVEISGLARALAWRRSTPCCRQYTAVGIGLRAASRCQSPVVTGIGTMT